MGWRRSIQALVGCIVLGVMLDVAMAQDAVDPAMRCEQGVEAFRQNQSRKAVDLLLPLFATMPDFVHPEHGAVAYWLGRAYEAERQEQQAYEIWETGYQALLARGLADVWLSDALVQAIYRRGDASRYALGADAYLNLLAYLDARPTGDLWDLLAGHLEALALILPAQALQATGLTQGNLRPSTIKAGAGSYLVRWWRSQDALPATRENERLHEHLARVAYAGKHYTYNGRVDDRAAIYIRLGKPYHETTIAFNSTEFRNKVLKRMPTVTVFSFPQNAYWVYKQIDRTAQYLFVKKHGRAFRLGTPNDLIPETLQVGTGGTQRGVDKAEALVWTMQEMYRQLALYHPAFLSRYNDAADYAEQLDNIEFLGELDRRSEVLNAQDRSAEATRNQGGNADAKTQARLRDLSVMPDVFTRNMIMTADADDNMAAHDRAARVPPSYTNQLGGAEPMDMNVRVARFLNADGVTRAEVYWSTSAQQLRPGAQAYSSPYFLLLSVVQKATDYQEQAVQVGGHLIGNDFLQDNTQVLAPQQEVVPGDTATFHLAMQWDLYATKQNADGQLVRNGRPLKANVYRADTLAALSRDAGTLEMSDLKPMMLDESALATPNMADAATLYPFFGLENDTPLALYFEVYHLAYGADDETHYNVEYEIKRRRLGSLLRLRQEREDRISARTDLSGSNRTAQELIALDLSAWEGTGEVEVAIHVTDLVSGQQVVRSLFFELVEAGK